MDLKLLYGLNPIFKNLNRNKLITFLSFDLITKKNKYNLLLSIEDFNKKYTEFDINYYILFNDDLVKTLGTLINYYIHYINYGINENRIISKKTFMKHYKNFNFIFFTKVNKILDVKLNSIIFNKYDIKLDKTLKILKIYNIEKNNKNTEFILDENDFKSKYPKIEFEIISFFNKDIFGDLTKKINFTQDDIINIIKFYLDNKYKNKNKINIIFTIEDFEKKYPKFDYDFFTEINNFKMKKLEAMLYYHYNIDKNEDVIFNKDDISEIDYKKEIENENFNWEFYINLYPDLKNKDFCNENIAYLHYKEYGKNEGRICNTNDLISKSFINLKCDEENLNNLDEKPEFLINILIKSTDNSQNIIKCIQSILDQNYNNYRIIIDCKNKNNFKISQKYTDKRIEYYNENTNKYDLLKYIKKGWIILLDNDIKLSDKNALKLLNNYLGLKNFIFKLEWEEMCKNKNIYKNLKDNIYLFYFENDININIDLEKYIKNYLKNETRNIKTIDKVLLDEIRKDICIFHCGNIEIFIEIINHFPEIKEYNLIITFYNDNYHNIIENLNLSIIKLIKVENKGTDCGPMLLSIDFLLKNKHLYDKTTKFIKIHTKSIEDWRNKLIKEIITFDDKNYIECEKPIIFGNNEYIYDDSKGINREYIINIVNRNEKDKEIFNFYDLYYDEHVGNDKNNNFQDLTPSLEFYKNYEPDLNHLIDLKHWYEHGIYEFHRKNNINYIKKYRKYTNKFVAGTIFGFNQVYLELFKNYNMSYEYSILETGYVNNFLPTKIHSWEYYFGLKVFLNGGIILGKLNNNIFKYEKELSTPIIKYSLINTKFNNSNIAIFLLLPGENPESGGYRSLLKYINYLNQKGYSLDIYFGIAWNDEEISYNVDDLNQDGMPTCKNWLKENDYDIIYKLVDNIKKYNILDINLNNFYLGLRCQKKYKILIANAWQIAGAVYKNKEYADKLYYIIQDREELFYPEDDYLKQYVLKTYQPEYNYYFITKYLGNYFQDTYNFENICSSYMGVNLSIYKNLNFEREKSIVIPYYQDLKPGRKPELVEKIIKILSENKIKCYIYPYDFDMVDENIINIGILKEDELNDLYNRSSIGIVFSNTNPSRLGFEMYASGLQVIEYETIFTEYDMPDKYFTKIKDENNILEIVNNLFNKKYDDGFLKNIDINNDFEKFYNFIKKKM